MKKAFLVLILVLSVFLSGYSRNFENAISPASEEILPQGLDVYPLNVGMAYYNYATPIPDIVYNTLGSENGLAGSIYLFDGVVKEIVPLNAAGVPVEYAKIQTDRGMVIVLNMYNGIYNETLKRQGEWTAKHMYSDVADYYVFPQIGKEAKFLCVYTGYSLTHDMPTFELGASADIFALEELPDPVAEELQKKLNELNS